MSDFDLTELIRKVIDETDLATPAEVAAKVAEMVPSKHLRAVFAEVLVDIVRIEFGRLRRAAPLPPARAPRRQANQSSKVRGLRDYADAWRLRLKDRLHVGQGREAWKLLADCSAADFRYAATERRTLAAGALRLADEFDSFAAACDKHKVSRFADLPEDVQAELLGGKAAAA